MNETAEFIIKNFVKPEFLKRNEPEYKLIEKKKEGKSELIWRCKNKINFCIPNYDDSEFSFSFFKTEKELHLNKRVDHIIFEKNKNNKWDAYLIEMKTKVNSDEWDDIKGKFRSGYFFVKAFSSILEMEIGSLYFYTTYENVNFSIGLDDWIKKRIRQSPGLDSTPPEKEWSGEEFSIFLNLRLPFKHTPIKMLRNQEGILVGILNS